MKRAESAEHRGRWRAWHIHVAGAAFLLGVTLGAHLLWLRPLLREADEAEALTAEVAVRRRKLAALKEGHRVLERALADERRLLSAADVPLEPASNVNARIVRLTELAGECGLLLDGVESGKRMTLTTRDGAKRPAVAIRLTARGSFRDCVGFLETLGERLVDTAVANADLTGMPGTDGPITLSLDLTWHTGQESADAR